MTAKKAKRTPRKTSSPVRRSPRLAEKDDDSQDDLEDTIISGVDFSHVRNKMREAAGAVARNVLGDVTNNAKVEHKKRVEEAASPMLPRREDCSDKENPPWTPKSAKKDPLSSRTEVRMR